ncbi:MAG TPA: hypothetical protein VF528_08830 [Pyrinomonadaceae bacterium]|jgi:vacuolar-type H+-ATPase subunit I/STV1
MSQEFKSIQIIPFTEAEKKQLIKNADDATKAHSFQFTLSAQPTPKWAEIFQALWQKEYGNAPTPRISGKSILITSALQHLQNILNALKLVTSATNERFKAVTDEKNRKEAEEKKRKDETKKTAEQAMTDALNKLNF